MWGTAQSDEVDQRSLGAPALVGFPLPNGILPGKFTCGTLPKTDECLAYIRFPLRVYDVVPWVLTNRTTVSKNQGVTTPNGVYDTLTTGARSGKSHEDTSEMNINAEYFGMKASDEAAGVE